MCVTIVFSKAQPIKTFQVLRFATPSQQSMPFTLHSKEPPDEALHLLCLLVFLKLSLSIYHFRLRFRRPSPSKSSIYCILRFRRKDKCGTIVLSKAQPSKILHLPCFRRFSLAKHCIYCFSKALRSKVSSLFMLATAQPSIFRLNQTKIQLIVLFVSAQPRIFQLIQAKQHSRAKYRVYCVFLFLLAVVSRVEQSSRIELKCRVYTVFPSFVEHVRSPAGSDSSGEPIF